ncbi:MAG: cell surface protein SprA [Prolixibacteraceae bacterium]|nr:cell surface protein SprA [Prolixibacteraceae bacterium]MBN2775648.1 cell surface protein SprA [Prolixibacteraceae bacterium]
MRRLVRTIFAFNVLLWFLGLNCFALVPEGNNLIPSDSYVYQDTVKTDTTGNLPYPFKDEPAFSITDTESDSSALFLEKPGNIKYEIVYDPLTGEYVFYEKIGDFNYRLPKTMSLDDYIDYDFKKSIREYWRHRTSIEDMEQQGSLIPKLTIGGEAFNRIFGGNTVNIRPQGYVEVSFGYQMNATDNPAIPERLRKVPAFDFDEKIQMNVTGEIGEKMKMRVNYNTEATFDYENKMNIEYTGDEDEIIKRIEAGNVSLPLNGSLITGASNLFGVKAEMQFGKLTLTTLFSQHKGETRSVQTEGGAQITNYEISSADYDANRHFFLAQYFRNHYNEALRNLQYVQSNITINKIEVWITNKSSDFDDSRNLIALQDLGEREPNIYNNVPEFQETMGLPYPDYLYPSNQANGMYEQMSTTYNAIRDAENITSIMASFGSAFTGGRDFEKLENARKLNSTEYTVNLQLGYISLNQALNADEILAVAFNFTANGKTYQVGEFSTDGIDAPQTLILKLLKGTNLSPSLPTWDLMMKNVYKLDAYELTSDDFELNIMYHNDSTGTYINYLPASRIEGHILLEVVNLDKLNSQRDPYKDGVFDYVEGLTVNSRSAHIFFPVLEPFGKDLADSIQDKNYIEKFVFQSLYDSTKTYAEQDAEHNKFIISGSYKGSSSSEISVGSINLAQGSVKVTAGGRELVENVDYTVDYALGRVKIINQGLLDAGTPINVSTESEDLFSMQRKTMLGAHANYEISDNFNIGATMLHMQERPLTSKVDYGEDPISNTIMGMDARFNTESRFLTKLVDKLPFYNTKAPSSIDMEVEVAKLYPGHSKVIKNSGTAYIDDFESTKTNIDMRTKQAWVMASTPQYQQLFPEANVSNSLVYGFNRAKLAWYVIDPLFLRNNSLTPSHIKNDIELQSNHLVREVFEKEIFPAKETPVGVPTNISILDLAYYPSERGPYNFETDPTAYSAGLNPDGTLRNPESRWGGIMRQIESSDFETQNIEFIEFWVMDPFINDENQVNTGGDLYFNLGEISEDILKDSKKTFENGLPSTSQVVNVDTTIWGRVPTQQSLVNSFDASTEARQYQDVGLDGLSDTDEQSFYQPYIEKIENILDQTALNDFLDDPSADDYHYFRGSDYDEQELGILERYKEYNGFEGNSPTTEMKIESYPTSSSTLPDVEDINDDNTLNEYERYYQYRVSIRREDMVLGHNYITDIRTANIQLKNGNTDEVKWYQFKIPVRSPDQVYGSINDFKSIRFMRMFLTGFADPVVLRFATLDLVRADWRRYTRDLAEENVASPNTEFDLSAVNIEENGSRRPINYILPPGIDRVIDPANPQLRQMNEQSMMLKVIDLEQGDARGAYKNIGMDFRMYKKMRMEVHAEEIDGYELNDNELSVFIRLGSDFNYNYYEYEVPLVLTPFGTYNSEIELDREKVWPDSNRIDLPLEVFTDVKQERNAQVRQAGSTLSMQDIYEVLQGGNRKVKVKGNPNLGSVSVMMIGIRNPKKSVNTGPRSVEVWVNELRLTDFDEEGGWAANSRVTARLADLGSVTFAGRTRSAGFGSIEQSINERSLEDLTEYDIASSIDLGKFFPEKIGVRLPMYFGYSQSVKTPKYNPLDPDIELKESLQNAETREIRDSIKNISQDLIQRKSINFNNVRIEPKTASNKQSIISPQNFAVSYSYSETYRRNITTEYNINKNYRGMFSYNYSSRSELFSPFKKIKFLQKGPLKLIGDFGFYPLPTQISFRTDLTRTYNEVQTRNITNPALRLPRTFRKDFLWNRVFDLRYNITSSLKFDFTSNGTSRIDEPEGRINRHDDDYQWKKDSILTNLWNMGRPTLYNHNVNISYRLPLNKFKLLNFLSSQVTYRGSYNWVAGPITADTVHLGNTIENDQSVSFITNMQMTQLYNLVPYFKEINSKYKRTGRSYASRGRSTSRVPQPSARQKQTEETEVTFKEENLTFMANLPKRITHKLNTENVTVEVKNAEGIQIQGNVEVLDKNKIAFTSTSDLKGATVNIVGIKTTKNVLKEILDLSTRVLLGVQNISVNYSIAGGTVLPGFLPEPKLFGGVKYKPDQAMFGDNFMESFAPGVPFLFGWQDEKFPMKAARNGWITSDSLLNTPYAINKTETFSVRSTIEPLPDLQIQLTAERRFAKNFREFFRYNYNTGVFEGNSRSEGGSFSMSTFTWGTAFFSIGNSEVKSSEAFENFKNYRSIIAERLAAKRATTPGAGYSRGDEPFPDGFGPTSVEVMVPAFLAAYQKRDPEKVALGMFPSIKHIRPNWRISYDGMINQIPGLNQIIKSLNFTHAYTSSYQVGSFLTNLNFEADDNGLSYIRDIQNNFVPQYEFNSVTIREAFSPLINMDIMWANDLSTRTNINRSRTLNMSFSNNQLTEVLSNEYGFGVGFRFSQMDLIIKTKNSQKSYSNDLNVTADLTLRKNKTILRKLVEGDNQITAGTSALNLKTTADYMLSDRFQLRLYFDKVINTPFTSNTFRTANTNFGVSFRFTLAQ